MSDFWIKYLQANTYSGLHKDKFGWKTIWWQTIAILRKPFAVNASVWM